MGQRKTNSDFNNKIIVPEIKFDQEQDPSIASTTYKNNKILRESVAVVKNSPFQSGIHSPVCINSNRELLPGGYKPVRLQMINRSRIKGSENLSQRGDN